MNTFYVTALCDTCHTCDTTINIQKKKKNKNELKLYLQYREITIRVVFLSENILIL